MSFETLININSKIEELNQLASQGRISSAYPGEALEEFLEPLVESGVMIQEAMLSSGSLTEEEEEIARNATEVELAQLSLALSASQDSRNEWNTDRVISCISVALGIRAMAEIAANIARFVTVEGAVKALKLIGKRYLGWIGIAVCSFGECIDVW